MKHVPNIISACRISLSLLLFFLLRDRGLFAVLFVICGVSDVIDGYIARKWNVKSVAGAKLDSFADLFMFTAITVAVVYWAGERLMGLVPYILAIFLIRILNMAFAYVKFHSFAIIHTWGNKITGLAVFAASVVFILTDEIWVFLPVCLLANLSALEEAVIHIISEKLDLNRRSLFKP